MELTEIEEKITRLALDAGAQEGERAAAALKLIESLRARGVTVEDLMAETEMPFENEDYEEYEPTAEEQFAEEEFDRQECIRKNDDLMRQEHPWFYWIGVCFNPIFWLSLPLMPFVMILGFFDGWGVKGESKTFSPFEKKFLSWRNMVIKMVALIGAIIMLIGLIAVTIQTPRSSYILTTLIWAAMITYFVGKRHWKQLERFASK